MADVEHVGSRYGLSMTTPLSLVDDLLRTRVIGVDDAATHLAKN